MKSILRLAIPVCLFLFSMNLFNMESRLIVIVFVLFLIANKKKGIRFSKTNGILTIFCICFYMFASIYNPRMMTYYILPFLLGPIMGYMTGYGLEKNLILTKNEDAEQSIKIIIYAIVFGRFTHGLLNFIISDGYSGYVRNGMDIWTKNIIAATGQGALMTMSISLLFYSLFVVKKSSLFEKTILLGAVIMSMINSILSASRTALLIMIIVFALCALYTIVFSKLESSSKSKIILGLIIVLGIFVAMYHSNTFGLKTSWESSPLMERINTDTSYETGDENRKEMYISALQTGIKNPLGDGDMSRTAHNIWLDTFRQTGWFPFVFLIVFTVIVIKKIFFIIRSKSANIQIKYLVLSVTAAMLINFFVEPIMKGMPFYFTSFCIIAGVIDKYVELLRIKE